MSLPHRLPSMLGLLAAVGLAGLYGSTALAHADSASDTPYVPYAPYASDVPDGSAASYGSDVFTVPDDCVGGVCLVMGDPVGTYAGFRPYLTDWQGNQPYTVEVGQSDGSTIEAGSYNIHYQDFWTSMVSSSTYHYDPFVPTAAAAGLDLNGFDDLGGVTVYNTSLFDGQIHQLSIDNLDGFNYYVTTTGSFTNTLVTGTMASADYYQIGDAAPVQLYNTLDDPGFASVPGFALPPDPWATPDFDPSEYLAGLAAT